MGDRDRISLTGVSATGHHGVLAHERRDGQLFVVDLVLHRDLGPAADSDDLGRTVNYAAVAADVVEIISGPPLDLIEAVAARIATRVLEAYQVGTVEVTVHKPQAPVGVPFNDVAVTVVRHREVPVVIALGANLGDPESTVEAAIRRLRRTGGLRRVRTSEVMRTSPVGGPPGQPDYRNAIALATTRLIPVDLLAALHRIEDDFGRTRHTRWEARTLDLDLIQYGEPGTPHEFRSDDPELTLPHPRAAHRPFVLEPWLQLDPLATLRTADGIQAVADLAAAAGPT